MRLSTDELARARRVVGELLDDLGIESYLFEVEPGEGDWELWIECAISEGWSRHRVAVEKDRLLRADDDAAVRRELVRTWEKALGPCLRRV